ncbi:Coiled-coil domain-containing protein 58 [Desmophyllum pertusum]|uniref:Coiled-coil domain-containing protein 58 n=1 Tax=Desmophyllum pertusum TaxID=174260 RepID=A0A9X0A0K6_9CNID|nr:Coiled-coil domain-containing protein 58 [Desmophyllum pertusum]
MASRSSLVAASTEAAFEAFWVEFTQNGFNVPEGLIFLLRNFTLKHGETPKDGRARFYRRLWCLLWYGTQQTLGANVGGQPTYVFPPTLKRVVRNIIHGELVDRPDPTHTRVYKINIGDLANAKWPTVKNNRKQKKK